ncbi:hypothetical protein FJT64_003439 [Amphibalanus amphitrite]|uniref:Uncharacterized protein n=1 Tax=Amphibalanus amphitrite TaxID=1232801 RepID=A0A6A4W385_AMPAM|nr:hypothetical protein FJT64_003439 [Amphibalanus amphitrite]
MLRVAVSDFPVYDESTPPDEFITRCRRLATLGDIPVLVATLVSVLCTLAVLLTLWVISTFCCRRRAIQTPPPPVQVEHGPDSSLIATRGPRRTAHARP